MNRARLTGVDLDVSSTLTIDQAAVRLGIEELRPQQRTAIESLVAGTDVLAIIPTGGGKSAIYQAATLVLGGVTVIVSPLLALQADQIRSIEDADIGRAVSIDGSTSPSERERAFTALAERRARFLFATPEILSDDAVVERLADIGICLFAVDEAHCIVTWGQGFRPEFVALGDVRRRLGSPTTVALTGSADPRIRADVCRSLDIIDGELVTADLLRSNIELSVVTAETQAAAADCLADHLDTVEGKALVYVPTRKLTVEMASRLDRPGRPALPFHGGLKKPAKQEALDLIRTDPRAVVIATTAFGMGIDIPDIGSVAHLDMPDSLLAYYQEVGRGGRDGEPAQGCAFVSLRTRSRRAFGSGVRETSVTDCAAVYVAIQDGASSRRALIDRLPMNAGRIARALDVLHQAGAISTEPRVTVVDQTDPELIEAICRQREEFDRSQLLAVERYCSVRQCRWAQILTSLGEPLERCGHCDICLSDHVGDATDDGPTQAGDDDEPFPVGALVEHSEFGVGTVTSRRTDVITVSFESVGPKELATELCVGSGLLESATEH